MTSRDLEIINRRVDILYRSTCGDSNTAIAQILGISRQAVIDNLKKAKIDKRIVATVKLKQDIINKELYD